MDINELMQKLSAREGVSNVSLVRNNVVKCDIEKDLSKEFFKDLKNEFGFEHCSLITAIDNQPEFELVYHFTSVNKSVTVDSSDLSVMVEIHIYLDRDSPTIESISDLWGGANWHERECYDLFGIIFDNHPDLRRILTDYNFVGHPLRKDFPLTGHNEVRYDDLQKKVIYEPVNLQQEYRNFDFSSPWEGYSRDLLNKENNSDKDNE